MKNTLRRVFESNRIRANQNCPCGQKNNGEFATEKGFSGQPVGKCFKCNENFYKGQAKIVSPVEVYTPPVEFCRPQTKDLEDSFDYTLKSGFAKFLIEKFGLEEATRVVEKYYLGVTDQFAHGANDPGTIFWQVDRNTEIRCGKIIPYLPSGKRDKNQNPNWWHSIKR